MPVVIRRPTLRRDDVVMMIEVEAVASGTHGDRKLQWVRTYDVRGVETTHAALGRWTDWIFDVLRGHDLDLRLNIPVGSSDMDGSLIDM